MCPCSRHPTIRSLAPPAHGECPALDDIVEDHEREHISEAEGGDGSACYPHWSGTQRLGPGAAESAQEQGRRAECRLREASLAALTAYYNAHAGMGTGEPVACLAYATAMMEELNVALRECRRDGH